MGYRARAKWTEKWGAVVPLSVGGGARARSPYNTMPPGTRPTSNRLQPNREKTEVLWCATTRRQHQLPTSPLLIDVCSVSPVKSVRDLGIHTDSDLTMQTQVKRTVSRCFASLRQLRQIGHLVPTATLQMLVVALVHSRLDYGNSVLVGLPAYLLRQ